MEGSNAQAEKQYESMTREQLVDELKYQKKVLDTTQDTNKQLQAEMVQLHEIIHYWKKEYEEVKMKESNLQLTATQKMQLVKETILHSRMQKVITKQLQKEFDRFRWQTEKMQIENQKVVDGPRNEQIGDPSEMEMISIKKKSRRLNQKEVQLLMKTKDVEVQTDVAKFDGSSIKYTTPQKKQKAILISVNSSAPEEQILHVFQQNSRDEYQELNSGDISTKRSRKLIFADPQSENQNPNQAEQNFSNLARVSPAQQQEAIQSTIPPPPAGLPIPPPFCKIIINPSIAQQQNEVTNSKSAPPPPPMMGNVPPPPGGSLPPPPPGQNIPSPSGSMMQQPQNASMILPPPPPPPMNGLSNAPPPPPGAPPLPPNMAPPPLPGGPLPQSNIPPPPGFAPPPPPSSGPPPPPPFGGPSIGIAPPPGSAPPPPPGMVPPPPGMVPPPPGNAPPPPPGAAPLPPAGMPPPPPGFAPPPPGTSPGMPPPPPGMAPPPPGMAPPPPGMPPPPPGMAPPPPGMPPLPPGMAPPPPGMAPPPPGGAPPPPGGLPRPGGLPPPGMPRPGQQPTPSNEVKIEPPPKGLVPKRLHWKIIPKFKLKNTFFGKDYNPNDYQAEVDYEMLQEAFCKKEEDLKHEEEEKKKIQNKVSKVVFILEQKRISDTGIQLSGYSLSSQETVNALLNLNDQVLDSELIQKLQRISPNADETALLSGYKGNLSDLSSIEQFLMNLIKVPSLNERLESMLFRNKFDYEYTELIKNIEQVDSAVVGIRDNDKLKELIAMILKVGNYLNFGTNKGKAIGFQMELLLQLSQIKSIGGKQKMSLLDLIIHSVRKNKPGLLNFTNDLVPCDFASKIDMSMLQQRVQEFEAGIEKIRKELKKTEEVIFGLRDELEALKMEQEDNEYGNEAEEGVTLGGPTPGGPTPGCDTLSKGSARGERIDDLENKLQLYEKFYNTFSDFLADSDKKTDFVKERVTSLVKDVSEVIVLFGEDASIKSTEFFKMFYDFAREFSSSYKNILLSEKVKKEQEERKRLASQNNSATNKKAIQKSKTIFDKDKKPSMLSKDVPSTSKKNIFAKGSDKKGKEKSESKNNSPSKRQQTNEESKEEQKEEQKQQVKSKQSDLHLKLESAHTMNFDKGFISREETDLVDNEESKSGADVINFGMTRADEVIADSQKVYKKAKKLVAYNQEEQMLPSQQESIEHSQKQKSLFHSHKNRPVKVQHQPHEEEADENLGAGTFETAMARTNVHKQELMDSSKKFGGSRNIFNKKRSGSNVPTDTHVIATEEKRPQRDKSTFGLQRKFNFGQNQQDITPNKGNSQSKVRVEGGIIKL